MGLVGWIVIGAIVLIVLLGIGVFNRLARQRNRIEAAWAQLDVRLNRRPPTVVRSVGGVSTAARERELPRAAGGADRHRGTDRLFAPVLQRAGAGLRQLAGPVPHERGGGSLRIQAEALLRSRDRIARA